LISTLYTVEAKDSANDTIIIQVLNQSGSGLTLLSSNKIQSKLVTEKRPEYVTTKVVNPVTSQTVTTTNDANIIENS
jgi:hypothetical protein